jgi:hypothetical protein
MAATDIKISQMTPATTLAGDELIPIVQNGANKSTTVNKVIEGLATEQWVTDAIADAGGKVLVVTELPAKGNPNTIYMVPNESSRANDVYDEYIWMVTTEKTGWEFLGNKHVEVDLTGYYNKTQVDKAIEDSEARSTAAIALKVDKVDGKQLSTNDYTTAEKQEVAKIANKVDKVDGKGLSTNDYTTEDKTAVGTIADKVDKVEGKQLSTEDYTTAEKTKLQGVADNANNYVHPTTAGNKHIPAGGTAGQILVNNGDGTAEWQDNQGGGGGIDYTGLEDIYSYGVEWDSTVADPTLTRIGNPLLHKSLPIQSQYKGCVANGAEINYYLNPNDWSQKVDGTPSVLDGTDGTVRVHIPKFYGKSGVEGTKRWVRMSTIKMDNTWIEIPEMLVDAYRSTVNQTGNKAVSVINTTAQFRGGGNRTANDAYLDTDAFRSDLGKPRTNISRANMRTYATNAGSEMLCYEYYKWIFYWAWVIEYATFNSQAAYNADLTAEGYHQGGLGDGVTTWDGTNWNNYNGYYPLTPCGYCNEFGNFTGVKDLVIPETVINDSTTVASKTFKVPRWRGFDNPFGDIWTNLDGIILERTAANQPSSVYTTTDPTAFGDDNTAKGKMTVAGTEIASGGYTKDYDLGETGEIIPSVVGGSTTTYMCDYHWCDASSTALRTLVVGGRADYGGNAGLGCFYSNLGVGYAAANVGFRTLNKVV